MFLLWAPFSFLLHNVIHEGAHALVAKLYGATILKFWPFPSFRTGYFSWASVEYTPVPKGFALRISAPVLAELLWLVFVVPAALLTQGLVQKILLIEIISANVDIVTWLLGYWNPWINPNCDAERFREELKFSRVAGKLYSLLHLPVLVACGYVVWRCYFAT